jgi:hypothetical protein
LDEIAALGVRSSAIAYAKELLAGRIEALGAASNKIESKVFADAG